MSTMSKDTGIKSTAQTDKYSYHHSPIQKFYSFEALLKLSEEEEREYQSRLEDKMLKENEEFLEEMKLFLKVCTDDLERNKRVQERVFA